MSKSTAISRTIMALGENVAKLRKKAKMTQQDLADAISVSYPRISEIENGNGNPRIGTIEKIANALGTTVSRLLREPAVK